MVRFLSASKNELEKEKEKLINEVENLKLRLLSPQ